MSEFRNKLRSVTTDVKGMKINFTVIGYPSATFVMNRRPWDTPSFPVEVIASGKEEINNAFAFFNRNQKEIEQFVDGLAEHFWPELGKGVKRG